MKFLEALKRSLTVKKKMPASETQAEQFTPMEKVLTMLSATREEELTCDEVFAALDQFTELAARGEDVGRLMPLIQHHLGMCPDCMEEYNALKNIVVSVA